MLYHYVGLIKEPSVLLNTTDPIWPAPVVLDSFFTAFDLSYILFVLLLIAFIELGLKHYKQIGYNFNKPFISNTFIFFLFKLGFYLMFTPMMLFITLSCMLLFSYNIFLSIIWYIPILIITIIIFGNVEFKTRLAKFGILSIFIFYVITYLSGKHINK